LLLFFSGAFHYHLISNHYLHTAIFPGKLPRATKIAEHYSFRQYHHHHNKMILTATRISFHLISNHPSTYRQAAARD
jgi:hypothetical protein